MRRLPRNPWRASRSWGWTRTGSTRMAAPSPSGIPLAPAAHGSWCISRIARREEGWRPCASAVAWAAPWCWHALERNGGTMKSFPPEKLAPTTPAWEPSPDFIQTTNLAWLMQQVGVSSYEALHAWSAQNREAYWQLAIKRLGIRFRRPFSQVGDLSRGVEQPRWLVEALLNIVESCFSAPADAPAIVEQKEGGEFRTISVGEL